ncbi:MAG: MtnX-like HAD-IB family phosphatase [Negativicutes bacterium]|nr:MtnX-like HAD-IB family phosphatase [Negativicutes bacterium]
MTECFLAIDFDGTIAETDVTDMILNKFARPEWLEIEELWVKGIMGSQECLTRQMALVDASLETLLTFVDGISMDHYFQEFTVFARAKGIPFAVISDGFSLFIKRILANANIRGIPIYANRLTEESGRLKASFTNHAIGCPAGTCKCLTAGKLSQGLPVVLIGDGRSDFCLANKADYVFAKGSLISYCKEAGIPFSCFDDFSDVVRGLQSLDISLPRRVG